MKKIKKISFSSNTEVLNDFQMKNVLGGSFSDCPDIPSGDCKTGKSCIYGGDYPREGKCGWTGDAITYCMCLPK